jgi:predicted RNA polymerase sigma factor
MRAIAAAKNKNDRIRSGEDSTALQPNPGVALRPREAKRQCQSGMWKTIPYQVPSPQELAERLGTVLQVAYLVFNEGYSAEATGSELSREAIRLGRLLRELLPEPEARGLLGLMLLQESRRAARSSPEGNLILLDQLDRSLWNQDQIAEGVALTESALASHRSAPIRCRPPLLRFTPKLHPQHLQTGSRSRHSTTG